MTDIVNRESSAGGEAAAGGIVFPVDVEHSGIRIAVPLMMFGGLVLVWGGMPALLDALGVQNILLQSLPVPLAILTAVLVGRFGDRFLKARWPSGRSLLLDADGLTLNDRKAEARTIYWRDRINVLAWRFTVSHRGRVPRGHFCLAFQLLQDDRQITAYTFFAPKEVDTAIPAAEQFVPLAPRNMLGDERLNMRVAGQQRRLLRAEDERWDHGAELLSADFAALWQAVQDHVQDEQG